MSTASSQEQEWEPPAVIEDLFTKQSGNKFAAINAPTSGARNDIPLPDGDQDFQLYSLGTPNGQKVSILLEELGVPYDAHTFNIGAGAQFNKGFVEVNPNSKIPCAVDRAPADGGEPVRLFESGAMMVYLAEKHGRFIPKDARGRAECLNWVFMQAAGQGVITGNFGHFFTYAPANQGAARDYGVGRYGMDAMRYADVLDKQLEGKKFIVGDDITIADFIMYPWYELLRRGGYKHQASGRTSREFLGMDKYTNANKWADMLKERVGVQRGMLVNGWADMAAPKPWLTDDKYAHLRTEAEKSELEAAAAAAKL